MRYELAIVAVLLAGHARAEPPRLAVFDFTLINTSPAPSSTEELERLRRLDAQLRSALASRYTVMPAQSPANAISIRGCNGCEIDIARELGAEQVAYGWVQKVSNLILNVNLVIEDTGNGQTLKADSVDIRSNTDDSWSRGLRYLLNERLFRE